MIENRSMKRRPLYTLQPLRITGGWQITLNTFHQLPFTAETLEWFDASVLIGGVHRQGQRCFDCAFLPEDDPDGEFVLSLMTDPQDRSDTVPGQDGLLEEFRTRDTVQLIARLEAFMLQTTQQADPASGHEAIAPLQAIRLPGGWEISHHQLPQRAFGADTLHAFNHPLLLAGAGREHGFSLGFEPAPQGLGEFVLRVERFKRNRQRQVYHRTSAGELRTPDPRRALDAIEQFAQGLEWSDALLLPATPEPGP
ncbi:hypothetical protein CF161_20574 [Pseudomonas sp. CF161]|nr:hypothetical protein CF161_20574 [Pseudomonas sp. CF161]